MSEDIKGLKGIVHLKKKENSVPKVPMYDFLSPWKIKEMLS